MKHNPAFLPSLMFVLAIHGALLYYLFKQEIIPPPEQLVTLMVDFIPSARPKEESKPEPPPPVPKPQPVKKPKARQLVAETPVLTESEPVAPPPPVEPELEPESEPVVEAPPAPPAPQMPAGPVTLSAELSVGCPQLNAPAYPPLSRRLGEEGKLVLRVELDEKGNVHMAQVVDSSGFKRLDEAAMAAVKTWRCNPPMRNGQPVRAIALQPFNFVLQGD